MRSTTLFATCTSFSIWSDSISGLFEKYNHQHQHDDLGSFDTRIEAGNRWMKSGEVLILKVREIIWRFLV